MKFFVIYVRSGPNISTTKACPLIAVDMIYFPMRARSWERMEWRARMSKRGFRGRGEHEASGQISVSEGISGRGEERGKGGRGEREAVSEPPQTEYERERGRGRGGVQQSE